jgi:hypothetical protein
MNLMSAVHKRNPVDWILAAVVLKLAAVVARFGTLLLRGLGSSAAKV